MRFYRIESIVHTIIIMLMVIILAILTITPSSMSFKFGSFFASRTAIPPAGYVRTKAYVEESPEIGLGFHKVPVMVHVPMIVFRKRKTLMTRPVAVPVCHGCNNGDLQIKIPTTRPQYLPPVKAGQQIIHNNVQFPIDSYDHYGSNYEDYTK